MTYPGYISTSSLIKTCFLLKYCKNLVRKINSNVKILGDGDLKKSLKLKVHAVTKSAEEKINKSGSTLEIINDKIRIKVVSRLLFLSCII